MVSEMKWAEYMAFGKVVFTPSEVRLSNSGGDAGQQWGQDTKGEAHCHALLIILVTAVWFSSWNCRFCSRVAFRDRKCAYATALDSILNFCGSCRLLTSSWNQTSCLCAFSLLRRPIAASLVEKKTWAAK